jgi:hypothetical protein
MMPVVDEYRRECLTIEVERSITAKEAAKTLGRAVRQKRRTRPHLLRQKA